MTKGVTVDKWIHFAPFLLTKPAGGWGIDFRGLVQAAIIAIVTALIVNQVGIVRLEERIVSLQRIVEKEIVYTQRDMHRIELRIDKLEGRIEHKDILKNAR